MEKVTLEKITLIGLPLEKKTTNQNGQSAIDCGNHWQKFEAGNYAATIPNKIDDDIFAVYHEYEGDHTAPYSYFIGCRVETGSEAPAGMKSLAIPGASYVKIVAKGKIPDCVGDAWKEIWKGDLRRTYQADFEIYGKKSKDWKAAEVEIYVGIK